ncbi:DUF6265 family protein [Edaphocola flava]|uniref:DUF6265 family protein n=1 Tax=Edaphocola flava TaxID=2499629 RepID=UPI00100A6481|nr:DUF6265 family protein [Edaphocola flava]
MKSIFTYIFLLCAGTTFAQTQFPDFLTGTWKVEGRNTFEHWALEAPTVLKGEGYEVRKNDAHKTTEYLSITYKGKDIVYTATVPGQNKGKPVDFKLVRSDSVFIFENKAHDFPKQIIYRLVGPNELKVKVTDGGLKGFTLIMKRVLPEMPATPQAIDNPRYDEALTRKLGGDEYGMKSYWLVILKTGPVTILNKDSVSTIFRGHLANIERLAEARKIIVAGPLGKNDHNYRGIFILNDIKTLEDAKSLLQTDPAVRSGLLEPEIYPWYGSAALPEYLEAADKIWKSRP